MICSFGAILAWKSDDDDAAAADADADDDYKSDPYMSPSYAGDTTKWSRTIPNFTSYILQCKGQFYNLANTVRHI